MKYENLSYIDVALPVIFRRDRVEKGGNHIHWHEAVELLLVLEGELLVQSNTETVTAHAGEIVCIHSNHLHRYAAVGAGSEYYCLILSPDLFDSDALFQSGLPLITRQSESVALYRKAVSALEQRPPFYKMLCKSLLTQLYISLAAEGGAEVAGVDRRMTGLVRDALEYIELHYALPLDIEQIAGQVGVSRYHLCHIFKLVTGRTLADFWQGVRCAQARKLLRRGESVAAAAEACGFSSAGYFSKVYQKHYAVLPSAEKRA